MDGGEQFGDAQDEIGEKIVGEEEHDKSVEDCSMCVGDKNGVVVVAANDDDVEVLIGELSRK